MLNDRVEINMPSHFSSEELERAIYDIAVEFDLKSGSTFPIHLVYNKAVDMGVAQNEVQNVLQSLKNRHLMTVQEKVTDKFFRYFERQMESA